MGLEELCVFQQSSEFFREEFMHHPMGSCSRDELCRMLPNIHTGVNLLSDDPINHALESGILKAACSKSWYSD